MFLGLEMQFNHQEGCKVKRPFSSVNHTESGRLLHWYTQQKVVVLLHSGIKNLMQGGGVQLSPPSPEVGKPATYWLLQKASKTSFPGFFCSVTKNQESHLCGIWSYSKALKASMGQLIFEVSGEECARIISTKQFADQSVTRTWHLGST